MAGSSGAEWLADRSDSSGELRPRFHGVGPSWSGWHVLTLPAPFRRQVGVGNVAVSHFKAWKRAKDDGLPCAGYGQIIPYYTGIYGYANWKCTLQTKLYCATTKKTANVGFHVRNLGMCKSVCCSNYPTANSCAGGSRSVGDWDRQATRLGVPSCAGMIHQLPRRSPENHRQKIRHQWLH